MPRSHPRTMRNLTMQRRHFQLIAETIRDLPYDSAREEGVTREEIAQAFARALRPTNPGFDTQRFLDACKPTDQTTT